MTNNDDDDNNSNNNNNNHNNHNDDNDNDDDDNDDDNDNDKDKDNDNDNEHVRVFDYFDWRGAAMSKKKNPACCDGNQVMGGAGEKLIEAQVMYGGVSDVEDEAQVRKLWRRKWCLSLSRSLYRTCNTLQ